jgi:hypothetical protein
LAGYGQQSAVDLEMILDAHSKVLGLNFVFVLVLFALFFIGARCLARATP